MDPSISNNLQNRHPHRRRRLVLILLFGSFFATPWAQAGVPGVIRRNIGRLIPRKIRFTGLLWSFVDAEEEEHEDAAVCGVETTDTSSAIQTLVENSLAEALYYRGGYKDEVAVETDAAAAAALIDVDVIKQQQEQLPGERIDLEAKAKEYGELEFSLFQKGDGSDEDPEGIPDRYLRMQLHRRELAKQACQATLDWRAENEIDTVLKRPHPDFDICKAVFPHYFITRDVEGHVVFVQRPALLNLDLAAKNNLDNEHLLAHYIYVNEYLWQIVEAESPLATMTSIIDLQGLNLSVLRQADLIHFLKEFVRTMDAHFPQRANKTLVVNAPKWFNVMYKLVSPLLRESTKAKIEIHGNGKRQDKALREKLGGGAETLVPKSFWTRERKKRKKKRTRDDNDEDDEDEEELPPQEDHVMSELEKDLREFTLARLEAANVTMQEVIPLEKEEHE